MLLASKQRIMLPSGSYTRESLLSFLQEHGVQCETYEHPVVMTVEEQAKHVGHQDGGLSKNLFLKDKKNRLYVVSALTTTTVDLKALSVRLGLGKGGLRMAPEESLQAVLQVPLGCVTPFALINESARSVSLLLDIGFKKQSRLFFHPLTNDASTALTAESLDVFLNAIGREPSYVDLEAAVVVGKDQPPDLAYLVPKEAETPETPTETKAPVVAPIAKEAPAKKQPKAVAVSKEAKDVGRMDISTVLSSILDQAVAAGVDSLDEEKKVAVADSIRRRLAPDLESLLMMFKNTMYAEGFKSAIDSQRLSSRQ